MFTFFASCEGIRHHSFLNSQTMIEGVLKGANHVSVFIFFCFNHKIHTFKLIATVYGRESVHNTVYL